MEVRTLGVSKRTIAFAPMPAHDLEPFRRRFATAFLTLTCSGGGSGQTAVELLGAICRLLSERGSRCRYFSLRGCRLGRQRCDRRGRFRRHLFRRPVILVVVVLLLLDVVVTVVAAAAISTRLAHLDPLRRRRYAFRPLRVPFRLPLRAQHLLGSPLSVANTTRIATSTQTTTTAPAARTEIGWTATSAATASASAAALSRRSFQSRGDTFGACLLLFEMKASKGKGNGPRKPTTK